MGEPGAAGVAPVGTTRIVAVIGSPVRHSRSPQLANAAFAAAGLDWAMVALEVAPGDAARAVAATRVLGLGGLAVTMPHKAEIAPALDGLTTTAEALGAVNSVAWVGDHLVGDNTDGAGLVAALTHDGIRVDGRRCAVLGAGGAARAVILALAGARAAEVVVINRSPERAEVAAALAGPIGRVGPAESVTDVDLIINATSVGMGASDPATGPTPLPTSLIGPQHVVVDLVYVPLRTPLLDAAAARGARTLDGLGMLVHQAALSIERWTGTSPDVEVMATAARRLR